MELSANAGLILDEWQQLSLYYGLAERADGKYAASDVGICVSRQNGKGSILEAVELGDLFLLDTELTVHSAHLFKTSKEAQLRLEQLIEMDPELDRYFSSHQGKTWHSTGQEGLQLFRDGKKRRIFFTTRTKGGGRGLTGDRVIIDEAMYYYPEQDAALRPTLSARPNPQIWLTGSAGTQESVMFGKMRRNAIKGRSPRLFWAEWSIDGHSDLCPKTCEDHDPDEGIESLAKANPGLGKRITEEFIETSERPMMDAKMFRIERLGVGDWPVDDEGWLIISEPHWMARQDELAAAGAPMVFGLDVEPDQKYSCITVAGPHGLNERVIEITQQNEFLLDYRPGVDWVLPRVKELAKRWKAPFVINKATQAGLYVDELKKAGVKLMLPTPREYMQGCGDFYANVVPKPGMTPTLVHRGQAGLNSAVAGAIKKDSGDMWLWDRRNTTSDITPLVSGTLAWWGLSKRLALPPPKPKAAWG